MLLGDFTLAVRYIISPMIIQLLTGCTSRKSPGPRDCYDATLQSKNQVPLKVSEANIGSDMLSGANARALQFIKEEIRLMTDCHYPTWPCDVWVGALALQHKPYKVDILNPKLTCPSPVTPET